MADEQFGNLDHQRIYGTEIETRYLFGNHWDAFLNISALDGKSEITHQNIPLLAKITASVGADWSWPLKSGERLIHNDVVAYGKREPWPDQLWNQGQAHYFPSRLDSFDDAFLIWNFGIHYQFENKAARGLDLALKIDNVLDAENYIQSSTVPQSNREAFWDVPYPRRYFQLSARFEVF